MKASKIFKISKNWHLIKSIDELISDSKFIFIKNKSYPRIVLKTPINGLNCIEISYDRYGLVDNGDSFFDENWGDQIEDSSTNCIEFIKKFLEYEGATDLINYQYETTT